ncbi:MAG: hypothetical protein E7055_12410 [Lentisphaerae bacterium]|nr:hypothetical protein [Lentisphaerota bacterium]
MKKAWMFLAAGCLALSLSAAENMPVGVKVGKTHVYRPQSYSFAQAATIYNAQNKYRFIIVQSKPSGEKPPRMQFWLSAGPFGFCNLVNFLHLTVNGISCARITPRIEDFVPWKEGDLAGCEAKFNFDGAKVILRFWMRPDSPVLWGSIRPAPDRLEEIKSAQVSFTAIVSHLAMKNKKVLWDKVYEREAVTPARTLEQRQKIWELTPEDTYLVLQDKKFDGSAAGKGQGPVMILLDHGSIKQAKLILRNSWTTSLSIALKPDFKNYEFGLWQQEPRISNTAFAEKLEAEKAAFTR